MSTAAMSAETRKLIADRLAKLAASNGGRLTPEAVVEDAKSKDSPLHDHFLWDTKKAAYQHWLDQARALIRSVRVEVITESKSVSVVGYVRDPRAGDEQGYVSITSLKSDRESAREALVGEFSRVADMLRRAKEIAAALDAQDEVDDLLQRTVGLRERFMEPPAQRQ
jgi:flagellar basal body rod protein FlgC